MAWKWPLKGFTAWKFLYHLMTPRYIYSVKIFVSLLIDFGWIWARFWVNLIRIYLNLTIKWARFSLILSEVIINFIDFLWIWPYFGVKFGWRFGFNFIQNVVILLSNFIENWFWKWMKYFSQILGFYYQIFIDLTLLQHFYFCITFWLILMNFKAILSQFDLNSFWLDFISISNWFWVKTWFIWILAG